VVAPFFYLGTGSDDRRCLPLILILPFGAGVTSLDSSGVALRAKVGLSRSHHLGERANNL